MFANGKCFTAANTRLLERQLEINKKAIKAPAQA